MRKVLLIIIITFLFFPKYSHAQNYVNAQETESQIDLIKDKVASRVAELKLVEKRGIIGVVESVTDTEIRINDLNDKTRIIDVDELTKFSSENKNTYDISDIKEGSKISAVGLYNKDSQHLLARFVNEITIPLFLSGVISDKDTKNFLINLKTEDEKNYKVDIEKITKTFSFIDGELETEGFSKIEPMQNAIVIGFPDPKDKNRISATRIIIFPEIPKNPRIEIENIIAPSKTTSPTPEKE